METGNDPSDMKIFFLIRAIILLPVMATIVIPGIILYATDSGRLDWQPEEPVDVMPLVTGIVLVVLGLFMAFRTVSLFVRWGDGTPAPWDPPRKLVVRGIYRHVRNPMISGVIGILIGESLVTGSLPLLGWALFFMAANLVYIRRFEETGLEKRFGEPYLRYKENVPRWIPRIRPWNASPEYNSYELDED
jgi:protein-S-isoprenylcysteine O-methyltransferase Ste14